LEPGSLSAILYRTPALLRVLHCVEPRHT
jgi:hypothetical protein